MVNKFYQKHKERLKNRARKRYQNIFGKKKKREKAKESSRKKSIFY